MLALCTEHRNVAPTEGKAAAGPLVTVAGAAGQPRYQEAHGKHGEKVIVDLPIHNVAI